MKKTSTSVLKRWGGFAVGRGEEKERGEGNKRRMDGWMTGGEWEERKNQRGAGSGEPLLPGRETVRIGSLAFSIFGLARTNYATLRVTLLTFGITDSNAVTLNSPSPFRNICFLLAIRYSRQRIETCPRYQLEVQILKYYYSHFRSIFQHCFHDIIFQTVRHPHRLSSSLGIE